MSDYPGQMHPKDTFWNLHAAPKLLTLAGGRLEHSLGGPPCERGLPRSALTIPTHQRPDPPTTARLNRPSPHNQDVDIVKRHA
jgi:hypothetical protein